MGNYVYRLLPFLYSLYLFIVLVSLTLDSFISKYLASTPILFKAVINIMNINMIVISILLLKATSRSHLVQNICNHAPESFYQRIQIYFELSISIYLQGCSVDYGNDKITWFMHKYLISAFKLQGYKITRQYNISG